MASADARLPPASVVISSTSTAYWAEAEARRFRGTVLERPVGAPTWIYHDHSFDARRGRTAASVPSAPEGRRDVCMIDLFTAMPLEELVTSEHSCIDAFYRIAGTHEPIEYSLRVQSAKLLLRSIASMYHASAVLPRDTALLWLDFDAVALQAPDAAFWSFVRSHDVSYVPYVDVPHAPGVHWRAERMTPPWKPGYRSVRLKSLADPAWRVYTAVMAFRVGQRSRSLLGAMLAHYDGGGAWLARACLCLPDRRARSLPCAEEWMAENLYFDPTYSWALHLHWAARADDADAAPRPELSNLSQGWLGVSPLGKGDRTGYLNTYYAPDDCLLFKRANFQAACPAAAKHVSQFDLWQTVDHQRHYNDSRPGPFAEYSHWRSIWRKRESARGTVWPELQMPPSTHGGWLHHRVTARNATPHQPLSRLESQLSGCGVDLPKPGWWES